MPQSCQTYTNTRLLMAETLFRRFQVEEGVAREALRQGFVQQARLSVTGLIGEVLDSTSLMPVSGKLEMDLVRVKTALADNDIPSGLCTEIIQLAENGWLSGLFCDYEKLFRLADEESAGSMQVQAIVTDSDIESLPSWKGREEAGLRQLQELVHSVRAQLQEW